MPLLGLGEDGLYVRLTKGLRRAFSSWVAKGERMADVVYSNSTPEAMTFSDVRARADQKWIEEHARMYLVARGVERPTFHQRVAAYVQATALLARARRASS